jgi:hypothetical protein
MDHRHLHRISGQPTLFLIHPQLAGADTSSFFLTIPGFNTEGGNRVNRPARILAAMFQGGGNIPVLMPVMAGLVAEGHNLRILAGPGL